MTQRPSSTAHLAPYQFKPGESGNPAGYSKRRESWMTCERLGFDVIEEAIKRYRDPKVPHASRDHALMIVADRVLPKLKAVEINAASSDKLQQVMIHVIAGEPRGATLIENSIAVPISLDEKPKT